ncbi:dual specificity protein kinase Yak1p [Monosporozyma unispora]|nr:dual specificity protein kinase yak1 [Kazachstania unispora]
MLQSNEPSRSTDSNSNASNDPNSSNNNNSMNMNTNNITSKPHQKVGFWNPNFLDNETTNSTSNNIDSYPSPNQQASTTSPQSQQFTNQQRQGQLSFNNPWDNGEPVTTTKQQSMYQSNDSSSQDYDMDQFESYKRRKSSLVIPPTRAAAPNPFEYDKPSFLMSGNFDINANKNNNFRRNSTAATFMTNSIQGSTPSTTTTAMNPMNHAAMSHQQQQRQALFNKQQQQQQQLNNRFVPSLYNSQEYQRRQSLATAAYTGNYTNNNNLNNSMMSHNNGMNHNANNNNTSTSPMYNNNSNGNSNSSLHTSMYNTPMNYSGLASIPSMPPYRRLSAYPTSGGSNATGSVAPFQPPFKQLRKDELLTKPQLIIPQMQKCITKNNLKPTVNDKPKYRRASVHSQTISPLKGLTKNLITTYQLCSPDFIYQTSKNPKRVLTKPSEPKFNNGYDNVNSDYILYVNDVLGTEQNRKYLVLDILGQGTFGQVVKCQNLQTKEILAVKVIKSRSEYLNQSITEAKILELLNTKIDPDNKHHFLRMFDSFVHKNHLCLVFELLSNNLYELLKQNQYHGLSIQLIKIFSKQMLDSLCVLKDSKLIHCDLKPENILLCSPDKPDIKVIDFGSSCEETRTVYTYIQSRFYRAPEIILGIPYSTSIDMWSLGCIVAELFLGIPIFPGSSEFNQITRIVETLNYPPNWMLEMGKNTSKFMTKLNESEIQDSKRKYRLKTVDEFNIDFKDMNEKPGKQYFKWSKLNDIIKHYKIPKNIQHSDDLIRQELKQRDCLINFLNGILNINPLERWTPQQAALHPFITNQPFTGEWFPPGSLPSLTKNRQQHQSPNDSTLSTNTNNNTQPAVTGRDNVDTEMTDAGDSMTPMKLDSPMNVDSKLTTTQTNNISNMGTTTTDSCKLENNGKKNALSPPEGTAKKFNDLTIRED